MSELDHALRARISEPSVGQGLSARVDELIDFHRTRELLGTTGTLASVAELALRSEGLEQTVRELASAVERLASTHRS